MDYICACKRLDCLVRLLCVPPCPPCSIRFSQLHEIAKQLQPYLAGLLRVELHTENIAVF